MPRPLPTPAEPEASPFATRAGLEAWLEEAGLEQLTRMSLGVLAPSVEAAYLPQLRALTGRYRLIDVASDESPAAWLAEPMVSSRMKALVPALARRFIEDEGAAADEAR